MGFRVSRLAPFAAFSALALTACATAPDASVSPPVISPPNAPPPAIVPYEPLTLIDPARGREIPVALYHPISTQPDGRAPLALVSHGNGSRNIYYSFISEALAARGYLVAAIQHQLPDDPPLAMTGDIYAERMPAWRLGEANLDYVMRELDARGLADESRGVVLVGHSHGGDISLLFAQDYPSRVRTAISLDNLRVPLPRTRSPQICSIRASDTTADEGVLPSEEDAAYYGIRIVKIEGIKHGDMQDWAAPEFKQQMIDAINQCLDAVPVS
jgi:dienelactone hydrolase